VRDGQEAGARLTVRAFTPPAILLPQRNAVRYARATVGYAAVEARARAAPVYASLSLFCHQMSLIEFLPRHRRTMFFLPR